MIQLSKGRLIIQSYLHFIVYVLDSFFKHQCSYCNISTIKLLMKYIPAVEQPRPSARKCIKSHRKSKNSKQRLLHYSSRAFRCCNRQKPVRTNWSIETKWYHYHNSTFLRRPSMICFASCLCWKQKQHVKHKSFLGFIFWSLILFFPAIKQHFDSDHRLHCSKKNGFP